jgi:predicted phage terminase large subunit-like protein
VLEVLRIKAEPSEIAAKLEALQSQYHAPLTIEATRDGKQVARALQAINPRLRIDEATPYASKYVRAQPVAGAWNAQRVRVPVAADWLDDFVFEVSKFTGLGDRHDDQIDALAYAWNAATAEAGGAIESGYFYR